VLLARLAERLAPRIVEVPLDAVLRLGAAYSKLGVLNGVLFEALAAELLRSWSSSASDVVTMTQITDIARMFSLQRVRHERLFDTVTSVLQDRQVSTSTPAEALDLLHSFAFLRLDKELGPLWDDLERHATSSGSDAGSVARLCYILFVARRDGERIGDIVKMLDTVSASIAAREDSSWASADGVALHHKLLFLRSALRYLHKGEYKSLPPSVLDILRTVHRMERQKPEARPPGNFVNKLSFILRKLKVAHICNAERGPLMFDIVERDRKLVYECNHFDRYYWSTFEKIASRTLQERIVKAMGYRVVQIPTWQWVRVKHKRARMEYLRMSRYYAIKDRREWVPRDDEPVDVAVNQFDHLGEYFFKKERPSSAWSWFSPQYDYTTRLPSAEGSATAE